MLAHVSSEVNSVLKESHIQGVSGTLAKYLLAQRFPCRLFLDPHGAALGLAKLLILNHEKWFCLLWLPNISMGTSIIRYRFKAKQCMCTY